MIGPPVSTHLVAALEAVGRVHRDRADAVVAEVLLHLADEVRSPSRPSRLAAISIVERRVDLGQLVGEDDVDDDAGDLLDRADVLPLLDSFPFVRQPFVSLSQSLSRAPRRPPTTSKISCVISAWRTRFISSVRSSIMSCAFSAALRIAVIRAPCSEAADSSSAR